MRNAQTWASLVALLTTSATPAFAQEAPTTATTATADDTNSAAPHHSHFDLGRFADDITLVPLGKVYGLLPRPVRTGLHNVLSNLDEPDIALNDLMQGHPGHAASAAFRFVTNTTIGVAGMFDVARHAGAHHHDNDAAATLAVYGVADGPRFHVPLIETDNMREVVGFAIDFVIDPVGWGRFHNADGFYASQFVLDAVDQQSQTQPPPTETAQADQTDATGVDTAFNVEGVEPFVDDE